jgi:hypothetical protein
VLRRVMHQGTQTTSTALASPSLFVHELPFFTR